MSPEQNILQEELNVAGKLISPEPVAVGHDGPVKLTCYLVQSQSVSSTIHSYTGVQPV
jgi:hypothetical protein